MSSTDHDMSADEKTIAVYNAKAGEYSTHFTVGDKPGAQMVRFMDALPAGGRVLDLGCGPAQSARHMLDAGFDVDAVDASQAMVRVAAKMNNVTVRLGTFDDITQIAAYDGIWANFSLLHAPENRLAHYINAIALALRSNGVFHIGMKVGTGMSRDAIDRRYTYVTPTFLDGLLTDAGLNVTATDEGSEVGLAGTNDPWVVKMAVKND